MVRIISQSFEMEQVDGIAMLKRIEAAGRTCYKSEGNITDDSYKAFVQKLIKSGHESVLEHEKVTVKVVCDRGVSHEFVRHRLCSFSQECVAGDTLLRKRLSIKQLFNRYWKGDILKSVAFMVPMLAQFKQRIPIMFDDIEAKL